MHRAWSALELTGVSVYLPVMLFQFLEKITELPYEYLPLLVPVGLKDFLDPPDLRQKMFLSFLVSSL